VYATLEMELPETYAIVILIQDADFIVALNGEGWMGKFSVESQMCFKLVR